MTNNPSHTWFQNATRYEYRGIRESILQVLKKDKNKDLNREKRLFQFVDRTLPRHGVVCPQKSFYWKTNTL